MSQLFAHSLPAPHQRSAWEPLLKHLTEVGEGAAANAAAFSGGEYAKIAGLFHDLGKAKPGFQDYISRPGAPHEPHAGEGALFACNQYGPKIGRLLAYCIAGHHAGLANGVSEGGGTAPLDARLELAELIDPASVEGLIVPAPPQSPPGPFAISPNKGEHPFATQFLVRMLFSCLVDADFLATEAFYAHAERKAVERGWRGEMPALKATLDLYLGRFADVQGEVNALRAEVLAACRAKAALAPGLFSLTVPTGGGKTLSALAFALEHARTHNLRRIIYVAPYTTIIEQTADEFRKALKDDDAILEHHSAFDWDRAPEEDRDDEGPDGLAKLRRAAWNWDRPIVVTTAVQFFESLFANRPSRCRKLHNIAKSVVILDEAQSLPLRLLRPCLAAVKELARGYGTSLVLCTATQPAVRKEDGFGAPEGLSEVREIAPDPLRLYSSLKRVRVEDLKAIGDDDLAARVASEAQVLCIVNTRRHARELFERLPVDSRVHLSTLMTPDHRRERLTDVRERLKNEAPVRLIATSLVEAGVDIDFPVVYRALAGIDSIAQASGRCNREGRLGREGGRVYVFAPVDQDGRKPPPDVRQLAEAARTILSKHADPLSLEAVRAYFEEVYWRRGHAELDAAKVGEDRRYSGIMEAIANGAPNLNFDFADIARAFRIIDSAMAPLIVPIEATPHGATERWIAELRHAPRPSAACRRALQRACVQVPPRVLKALIAARAAEVVRPDDFGDQFVLLNSRDLYSSECGLDWSDPTFMAAASLMA